jgi:hypothetical protein
MRGELSGERRGGKLATSQTLVPPIHLQQMHEYQIAA